MIKSIIALQKNTMLQKESCKKENPTSFNWLGFRNKKSLILDS